MPNINHSVHDKEVFSTYRNIARSVFDSGLSPHDSISVLGRLENWEAKNSPDEKTLIEKEIKDVYSFAGVQPPDKLIQALRLGMMPSTGTHDNSNEKHKNKVFSDIEDLIEKTDEVAVTKIRDVFTDNIKRLMASAKMDVQSTIAGSGNKGNFYKELARQFKSLIKSGERTPEQNRASIELQTRHLSPTAMAVRDDMERLSVISKARVQDFYSDFTHNLMGSQIIDAEKTNITKMSAETYGRPEEAYGILNDARQNGQEPEWKTKEMKDAAEKFLSAREIVSSVMTEARQSGLDNRMAAWQDVNTFASHLEYLTDNGLVSGSEKPLLAEQGMDVIKNARDLQVKYVESNIVGNSIDEGTLTKRMDVISQKMESAIQKLSPAPNVEKLKTREMALDF